MRLLARKPKPNLLSLDLIDLLKKLPETSLALNVLRPLLAEDEREVRENVVQWVENIRLATGTDSNLEERLMSVFSQLIEQKFKTLNYKELSQMLRLTPLPYYRILNTAPEAIITVEGLCIGGSAYFWRQGNASLRSLNFVQGQPNTLDFILRIRKGRNSSTQTIHVPVPTGNEAQAQQVIERLTSIH